MTLTEAYKQATPGPLIRPSLLATHLVDSQGRMIADVPHPNWMTTEQGFANAALLAHAFNVLPKLVVALEDMEQDMGTVPSAIIQGYRTTIRSLLAEANNVNV